jgi:hypothetical protein
LPSSPPQPSADVVVGAAPCQCHRCCRSPCLYRCRCRNNILPIDIKISLLAKM